VQAATGGEIDRAKLDPAPGGVITPAAATGGDCPDQPIGIEQHRLDLGQRMASTRRAPAIV